MTDDFLKGFNYLMDTDRGKGRDRGLPFAFFFYPQIPTTSDTGQIKAGVRKFPWVSQKGGRNLRYFHRRLDRNWRQNSITATLMC